MVNRVGLVGGLGPAFLDHVDAHAVFGAVRREIMELVRLVDCLNAVRSKDQPKLLAEWEVAKNVFGSTWAESPA